MAPSAVNRNAGQNGHPQPSLDDVKITGYKAHDLRFPTSLDLSGSDAMNPEPNYSAAYLILETNTNLTGYGFSFTIGRGNHLCAEAARMTAERIVGKSLSELTRDMGQTWRHLVSDSQMRWLGPEKGVVHLGLSACVNALWDLWARALDKPVWKLVYDMSPAEFVKCIDFRYIEDAITPEEAIKMLELQAPSKESRLEDTKRSEAIPAYSTQAGWLGFSDEHMAACIQQNLDAGIDKFKFKVGGSLQDDRRRLRIVRDMIGDSMMMVDANQVWGVQEAIDYMLALAEFQPKFIEEPTSPDDILGHAAIRAALKPHGIGVATGEHCQNRVMFKQLLQAGAIDYCQIDACRLGGVNEVMAVLLMAKKFNIPIVPHSGGIGLNEYTLHLALINYLCVSGEKSLLEHINSFSEVLIHPVQTKKGYFVTPTESGYSVQYKPEAMEKYSYPHGSFWQSPPGQKIINSPI